jgi:hypothetical protein
MEPVFGNVITDHIAYSKIYFMAGSLGFCNRIKKEAVAP